MRTRRFGTIVVLTVILGLCAIPASADPVGTTYDASGATTVLVGGGTLSTAGPFCASVGGLGDVEACGSVRRTVVGRVAWVLLGPEGGLGRQLLLYRQTAPGEWAELGGASEGFVDEWTDVGVRVANLDADPRREIVVGYRIAGTGQFLTLDVLDRVGGSLGVQAHIELTKGAARVERGRIRTRSALYGVDDPGCCPSQFDWSVVRNVAGTYQVTLTTARPIDAPLLWEDHFA